MEELKDSIISLRCVCLNMYQNLLNGTKWWNWLVLYIISYQLSTQRKPFFLYVGRDPIVLLDSLLVPIVRYLGTNENILSPEVLTNMYQLVTSNLEQAGKKRDAKASVLNKIFSEGDLVLLKDQTTDVWDPKYTRDYRIVSFPERTQVEVVDSMVK